jgi:hypothetical protein
MKSESVNEKPVPRVSIYRTRIGPGISVLGSALMLLGLFVPLFFTAPFVPSLFEGTNPYPPAVNGWQTITSYWIYPYPLPSVAPVVLLWLLLAVVILSTSLLMLFQVNPPLVSRTRSLAAPVSIAVLCDFWLSSIFLNWTWSPDAATVMVGFQLGPGFWLLLVGTTLNVIGVGKMSIGAILGAFCAMLINPYLGLLASFMIDRLPGPGRALLLEALSYPQGEIVSFFSSISLTLLGSLLGGWRFLRKQARGLTITI